jgi:hypothetical protein
MPAFDELATAVLYEHLDAFLRAFQMELQAYNPA